MKLCPACAEESARWLDYRPRPSIQLITPGRTSARDVLAAQRFRAEDTYALIRSQQALIRRICEREHPNPHAPGSPDWEVWVDKHQHIV